MYLSIILAVLGLHWFADLPGLEVAWATLPGARASNCSGLLQSINQGVMY